MKKVVSVVYLKRKVCVRWERKEKPSIKNSFFPSVLFSPFTQMRQVRPRNRFAVICHGDLWFSNILFRYCAAEAGNGSGSGGDGGGDGGGSGDVLVPTEVKFLDFQSARFASLATDLVLFLFTSVSVSGYAPIICKQTISQNLH